MSTIYYDPKTSRLEPEGIHTIVDMGISNLMAERSLSEETLTSVTDAMGQHERGYHNVPHQSQISMVGAKERRVFEAATGVSGGLLQAVAAVGGSFHDVVYTQVDGKILPRIRNVLIQYCDPIPETNEIRWKVKDMLPSDGSLAAKMALAIHGCVPGQELTIFPPGQNEALSCLYQAHVCQTEAGLPLEANAQIMTFIRATVPFEEQAQFETLAARCAKANYLLMKKKSTQLCILLSSEQIRMFMVLPETGRQILTYVSLNS